MNTILVSVISDQTIPNLLIIKELAGQYNSQVFISTEKMEREGKSRWIEQAAGLEQNSIPRVVVDENNWPDIKTKLKEYSWPENFNFLVNLTGGTKVMTLAIYEHFALPGNLIVYVPIGKNLIASLFPSNGAQPVQLTTRLNVSEYFLAHGVKFQKKEGTKKNMDELKIIFKTYQKKGYNIDNLNKGYSDEWKNYYTGEWFEEYLFYRIKKELNLAEGFIETGVSLMHFDGNVSEKNDQEMDLVFTWENELYIAEAKVSIGKKNVNKEHLYQILFKLSAINKNFGLRSHASVITLADISERSEDFRRDLNRKMKILGINKLIDRNRLTESGFSFRNLVN